jgi:hypothetical protein
MVRLPDGVHIMEHRYLASIANGMTIEDADGDEIGSVGMIYQPVSAAATPPTSVSADDAYMKVDRGFLGLGKHLYIPSSAIRDVTAHRVILTVDKDKIDLMGWDQKPHWIDN